MFFHLPKWIQFGSFVFLRRSWGSVGHLGDGDGVCRRPLDQHIHRTFPVLRLWTASMWGKWWLHWAKWGYTSSKLIDDVATYRWCTSIQESTLVLSTRPCSWMCQVREAWWVTFRLPGRGKSGVSVLGGSTGEAWSENATQLPEVLSLLSWQLINFIFSQGVQGLQMAPERLGDAARCLWSASCVVEPGSSLWPTSASGCHWLESADSGGIWWAVGERGVKPWRPWRSLWPCQVDLVLRGLCRQDMRMWGLPMQMRYTYCSNCNTTIYYYILL